MNSAPLRVMVIASEVTPFAKSGGLADVIGALPPALLRRGVDVRILMPRYGWIDREALSLHPQPMGVHLGSQEHWCAIREGALEGVPVYFLEHDLLYDRPHLYGPPGEGYADNCLRFALLSRSAIQLCHHLDWWPDVLHANDWQAALVPVYLNTLAGSTPLSRAASILTIHNIAFQGWFLKGDMEVIGLGWELFTHLGLESYDTINLLKGGIYNSTLVTTVSPTYAKEIQTPWFGEGLDGVLRSRRGDLFGVLNGIDQAVWDPETDPHLPRHFSAADLSGKAYCKAALQQEAGLAAHTDTPLIGIVTRLSQQKGLDLVAAALPRLMSMDLQLVLLGTGDQWAEDYFQQAAARWPERFGAWITFDERLAHLIEGGSDLFLMPSRWEPCGLNQMYSMRYGTLPIMRATGGLQDTGVDFDPATGEGNAFMFHDLSPEALVRAIHRAIETYRDNKLAYAAMVQRAMAEDHSWDRSAATYDYFYRLAQVRRRGG